MFENNSRICAKHSLIEQGGVCMYIIVIYMVSVSNSLEMYIVQSINKIKFKSN